MAAPHYQDLPPEAIPQLSPAEGVDIRVIAGQAAGVDGAIQRPDTEPLYLDIALAPGSAWTQPVTPEHNAFVYLYEGTATVGDKVIGPRTLAVLANDPAAGAVQLQSDAGARLLLIAGRPLREPIVQWGPFVMNSREEIEQAMADYRDGRFTDAP
jgi:redox-sensitive bicupin YhaK (pirin superfamily)